MQLAWLVLALAVTPKLQILNGSDQPAEVFWLKSPTERVSQGQVEPGQSKFITTTIGHRFAVVGQGGNVETVVTCEVPVQAVRFDPSGPGGIPQFYTQRISANGFPIVASNHVSPYALREAAYLIDLMLAKRPDVREAMIKSGSRLCIIAHDEFTTDQPEFAWLAKSPRREFPDVTPRDYIDARAGGSAAARLIPSAPAAKRTCWRMRGTRTRRSAS